LIRTFDAPTILSIADCHIESSGCENGLIAMIGVCTFTTVRPKPYGPQWARIATAMETQEDPEVVGARIKRRLLMGAALFLALASIYGGLLGIPWGIQLGVAAAAVFCVIKALRVPADMPPADGTPRRDG
jgi:hypothetical protein